MTANIQQCPPIATEESEEDAKVRGAGECKGNRGPPNPPTLDSLLHQVKQDRLYHDAEVAGISPFYMKFVTWTNSLG